MDTLGEMVEEEEKPSQESTPADVSDTESPNETPQGEDSADHQASDEKRVSPQIPTTPKDLIAQGASFLSGLAATLKSPKATEQLVNSLIETDAETGQTSLKIPVHDKQTIHNLLDIVGKLFG